MGGRSSQDAVTGDPAHVRAIPHRCLYRGVQGAQGKNLPYTVTLREAVDGGKVDHGAGDRGHATAGGAVHQKQGEDDGGAAHQKPGCTPPTHGQYGHISGPTTGACPCGHHQRNGDGGGKTTLQRSRARGDGLSEPPALDPDFWSGEQGVAADGSRLCGVASK